VNDNQSECEWSDQVVEASTTARLRAIEAVTGPGQPHELATIDVAGLRQRVFVNGPLTLRDLYQETLSDQPFLVYEDDRLTYAQAYAEAARIARVLVNDYGITRGDRVAISMRNYPEWILAFKAATSIGAIVVAMNALWQPEELEYGLRDSGAKVLFADRERLERLAHSSPGLDVQVIAVRCEPADPKVARLETLLAEVGAVDMPAADVGPEDMVLVLYTSGSTGHPKGVPSSHRNIISALLSWEVEARAAVVVSGVEPPPPLHPPATLLAVPLFHVMGTHVVYLSSYRAQRKIVSMYRWDPEKAAALVEREKITSFSGPAAMTGDLVRVAQHTGHDLSSLLSVGGGGAPRAPEQVRQIAASFANAAPGTGWGMTETNGIGTVIGGADYLARPTSAGRGLVVLDLKVIDETGAEVPPGERGELLIRGTSMFRGYWNRPELNAEVFIDDWFRTGDVATIDEDGFVAIVDRIKDLIIRGGENIGCGQVEAALLLHPAVREAAVYGIPDDRLGEEVAATVHADPALDMEALRNFVGEHLAKFEVPRYLRASPEPLPRTGSGKILKRRLKEEALAELAGPPQETARPEPLSSG
jgi:long-chain acyl-CoA synthetase